MCCCSTNNREYHFSVGHIVGVGERHGASRASAWMEENAGRTGVYNATFDRRHAAIYGGTVLCSPSLASH